MATVNVCFMPASVVKDLSTVGASSQVTSEAVTSSATSQATTITASNGDHVCRIAVSGNDVWVKFGPTPTAASASDILMLAGSVEYFDINEGDKVAVMDAA